MKTKTKSTATAPNNGKRNSGGADDVFSAAQKQGQYRRDQFVPYRGLA